MKIIFERDGDLDSLDVESMRYVTDKRGAGSCGAMITCTRKDGQKHPIPFWGRCTLAEYNSIEALVMLNSPLPFKLAQHTLELEPGIKNIRLVDNLTFQQLYNAAGTRKVPAL